jgi:PAS domain S-box-containing protein
MTGIDAMETRATHALINGQREALELALSGASVQAVLHVLARTAREQAGSDARAAIFLVDQSSISLRFAAADGMAEELIRAVDGCRIGFDSPSCGRAACTGEARIVSDVESDPDWGPHVALAREHGIRGCWSQPIRSSEGDVLGTVALYFRQPRAAEPADLVSLQLLAHTAAVVIERSQAAQERRHASERLKESEARFHSWADNAPGMIWVSDADGACTFMSRSWGVLTGLNAPAALGRGWLDVIHPQDRARAELEFRAASSTHEHFKIEYRLRRADGQFCWTMAAATPRMDESGNFLGFIGSVIDITERKLAEDQLRHSEAQLRAILDNSGAALYATSRDGRLLFVNRFFEQIMGKPAEDLVGRHLTELFEPATAAGFIAHNERVMAEGPLEFEESAHYGDVLRYYRSVKNPLLGTDGAINGIVGMSIDVTERRLATEALQQHRQELQTMLDLIPVGVAIAQDPRADHIVISPRYAAMLGLDTGTNASLTGPDRHSLPIQCVRNGQALAPEQLPMQRAARTGAEVRDDEFDVVLADGRVLNMMVSAAPLFDDAGNVRGSIGAHVDVTALKRVQKELEAADRQKDEFLATLAHELRNPMAPIRYAAALLRADASGQTVQQARQVIERQAAQMSRLLDDLLDMSRITRNVIELQRDTLSLSRLVDEAIDMARPAITGARHRLVVSTPAREIWVRGDPIRLMQVIGNLLNNAVKYTPPDGEIAVELREEEGQAVVSVRDSGIGLSPEMLGQVFQLFSQVHRQLKISKGGLGIGLAVVKRLVELHGGTIEARSQGLGRGAEFIVRLPETLEVGDAMPAPPQPGASAGTSSEEMRVLVVDDNADAAESLAMLLRMQDMQVLVAHDGASALRLAEAVRPDTVILDIGLPDIGGDEVARRLRQQPWAAGLRIVAVTGWGQDDDRTRTAAAGCDLHLVKPVDPDELLTILAVPYGQASRCPEIAREGVL